MKIIPTHSDKSAMGRLIFAALLCLVLTIVAPYGALADDIRSSQGSTSETDFLDKLIEESRFRKAANISELKILAERGDMETQYRLGDLFERGEGGVTKNLAEAVGWLREGAKQDLGSAYFEGDDFPEEDSVLVKWLIKAYRAGNPHALYIAYFLSENMDGVPRDYVEAVKWHRKAAVQGHAAAQYRLSELYRGGLGVAQDRGEGIRWLQKAAAGGFAEAQAELALNYDLGSGVQRDEAEANKWRRKAADQGHPWAQWSLGLAYENGRGIEQDYSKAASWYLKAAENGDETAQVKIGDFYKTGIGVPKNNVQAFKWYSKAAENGDTDGQVKLGEMYEIGLGDRADISKAMFWFKQAAEAPNGIGYEGAIKLGWIYYYGKDVEPNVSIAVKWWRKAATSEYYSGREHLLNICQALENSKSSDVSAKYTIGLDLFHGGWFDQDRKEGLQLITDSANAGYSDAQLFLGDRHFWGDGVLKSEAIAIDWYYRAGLSYLSYDSRDGALLSLERIENLDNNHWLGRKLKTAIYGSESIGERSGEPASPKRPSTPELSAPKVAQGTAWVVSKDLVVTNWHVVENGQSYSLILPNGDRLPAKVINKDPVNDLAILAINSTSHRFKAIPLANQLGRQGEDVFTIGFPIAEIMGYSPKLTSGKINSISGIRDDPRTYQISVPIQPGNSGGPLLNMRGEVVGIVTSKLAAIAMFKWTGDFPENVNYAVKADYLRPLLKSNTRDSLPNTSASLEELSARVSASVLIIIAE